MKLGEDMTISVTDGISGVAIKKGVFNDTEWPDRNKRTDDSGLDSYVPDGLHDEIIYSNYTSRGTNDSGVVISTDDQYLVRIRRSLFEKLKSFYDGSIDENELGNYVRETTKEYIKATSGDLSKLYCVFQKANVEAGVSANYDEAEKFWEKSGADHKNTDRYSRLKGSYCYNADYYYRSEDIRHCIEKTMNSVTQSEGVLSVDFDECLKKKRDSGGLSYNGVWNDSTFQLVRGYGRDGLRNNNVIDADFVPPKDFLYAGREDKSPDKNMINDILYGWNKESGNGTRGNVSRRLLEYKEGLYRENGDEDNISAFLKRYGLKFFDFKDFSFRLIYTKNILLSRRTVHDANCLQCTFIIR